MSDICQDPVLLVTMEIRESANMAVTQGLGAYRPANHRLPWLTCKMEIRDFSSVTLLTHSVHSVLCIYCNFIKRQWIEQTKKIKHPSSFVDFTDTYISLRPPFPVWIIRLKALLLTCHASETMKPQWHNLQSLITSYSLPHYSAGLVGHAQMAFIAFWTPIIFNPSLLHTHAASYTITVTPNIPLCH